MKRLVVICSLLVLPAVTVSAQLSPVVAAWIEGPVAELLTTEERITLDGLAENQEVFEFIKRFWARRDPDRSTPVNELLPDIAARIQTADQQFGEGELPGSLTDRGKVLLLLGTPSRRQSGNIAAYLDALSPDHDPTRYGVSFDADAGKAEVWTYELQDLPAGIKLDNRRQTVSFAFFDCWGSGEYRLRTDIRGGELSRQVLAAAPTTFLTQDQSF